MFDYIPNPLVLPVGIGIGVLVAAPVGPVNVLCIQRALERGFLGGIAAGLGAVLGDGLIALSASLGVGAITGAVETHRGIIQVVGGLALLAFGLRLSTERPKSIGVRAAEPKASLGAYFWDVPKTFLLTVTNPGAVLGLFAIFGGVGTFVELRGYIDAFVLVGAIALGSLGWWVFLSLLVSRFRKRFEGQSLATINRVAGLLLVAFGVVLIGEVWLAGHGLKWPQVLT